MAHVDFSKGMIKGSLSGGFTKTGLMGMLEDVDFNSVDVVPPFLGEIGDLCCSCTEAATPTTGFTKYIERLHGIYRKRKPPGLNPVDLPKLGDDIRFFKHLAIELFSVC